MNRYRKPAILALTGLLTITPLLEASAQRRGGQVGMSRSVTTRSAAGGVSGGISRTTSTTRYSGGGVRQTQVQNRAVGGAVGDDRGIIVGESGGAAWGERGGVAVGESGGAAWGERGGVAVGESGGAAWGEHGGVIVGDDRVAIAGEDRAFYAGKNLAGYHGERGTIIIADIDWNDYEPFHDYEDYWKFVAGVTTVMAIGALFTAPPPDYTVIVVESTSYYYYDYAFYEKVYHNGSVAYQVVRPPVGASVTVLPPNCAIMTINGVRYYHWTEQDVFYIQTGAQYQVVVRPN